MKLRIYIKSLFVFALLFCVSCREFISKKERVIVVQPFEDMPATLSQRVFDQLKKIHPRIILRDEIQLPCAAFHKPRNRYRADSLIHYLKKFGNADTVIIALTTHDISTTKGAINDWGVMGLGYCPGNACVVSTFRLKKENLYEQFYKVAIHELGHTQGLKHCAMKTCFMRDAEGGNPLNEEKEFCTSCQSFLVKRGWRLN